jgi:hypothetical protein
VLKTEMLDEAMKRRSDDIAAALSPLLMRLLQDVQVRSGSGRSVGRCGCNTHPGHFVYAQSVVGAACLESARSAALEALPWAWPDKRGHR